MYYTAVYIISTRTVILGKATLSNKQNGGKEKRTQTVVNRLLRVLPRRMHFEKRLNEGPWLIFK